MYVLANLISANIEDFMIQWREAMPPTLIHLLRLDLLADHIVLIDKQSLCYCSPSSLPMDPALRCQQLFKLKPKWKLEEIGRFIKPLTYDEKKVDSILLKHCRKITEAGDDGVYFVSRKRVKL